MGVPKEGGRGDVRKVYLSSVPFPFSMSKTGFDESMCDECGQPLFLTVEECKEFIEKKLQNGFIVCSCCGTDQKAKRMPD